MCGIAGVINLASTAQPDPGIAQRMADALYHRGPDEDGFWQGPGLVFANRRLSIVGLHDGQQPLHNEDRSVTVVFNGELFDYPEVRARLQQNGHQLRTHCDTEIVPHLWEDHGEDMLEKLRGQFALALFDQRRQQVILARDRFGICPLYWTRQTNNRGDWLLFASEIKALLASGVVAARPDRRGIHQAFTFFALPGPVTCFEGVNLLLPGHYLKIQLHQERETARVQEQTYWEMDFPDCGQEERRGFNYLSSNAKSAVVDEFEALLMKAVERRLRADVPVVSYLSGGVDSSVVVALACHLRRQAGKGPIPTFTIAVQDPQLNEKSEAALVSGHLHTDTVVVDYGPHEMLQTYPELIRAAEGPVIDTACAALLLLARRVHAAGYKVALTGEGADEWLAGYPWYKLHKIVTGLNLAGGLGDLVVRGYQRLRQIPVPSRQQQERVLQAVGGPNAWLTIYGLYSPAKRRFFSQNMWERLGDHLPFEDLQLNLDRARRWHPLNRSLYLGARVMLPGLLLAAKGDRVAMNSSVETRYPFLDEDVFAFLAKLHPGWKLRRFREKLLLRYVADRWVPSSIAWRSKAMFRAPFDSFHTAALPTFVDQLLSPESLRRTDYFDQAGVQHWRQHFRDLRAGSTERLMIEMGLAAVVATQLWHHTFIDGSLADLPSLASSASALATVATNGHSYPNALALEGRAG